MQYVTKKMCGNSLRPIIELDIFPGCLAMIDTGAEIPIIACPLKNTTYHIILPATMFDDMKYSIDNVCKEVIFEVEDDQLARHLKLQGKNGNLHIFSQCTPQKRTA